MDRSAGRWRCLLSVVALLGLSLRKGQVATTINALQPDTGQKNQIFLPVSHECPMTTTNSLKENLLASKLLS